MKVRAYVKMYVEKVFEIDDKFLPLIGYDTEDGALLQECYNVCNKVVTDEYPQGELVAVWTENDEDVLFEL